MGQWNLCFLFWHSCFTTLLSDPRSPFEVPAPLVWRSLGAYGSPPSSSSVVGLLAIGAARCAALPPSENGTRRSARFHRVLFPSRGGVFYFFRRALPWRFLVLQDTPPFCCFGILLYSDHFWKSSPPPRYCRTTSPRPSDPLPPPPQTPPTTPPQLPPPLFGNSCNTALLRSLVSFFEHQVTFNRSHPRVSLLEPRVHQKTLSLFPRSGPVSRVKRVNLSCFLFACSQRMPLPNVISSPFFLFPLVTFQPVSDLCSAFQTAFHVTLSFDSR